MRFNHGNKVLEYVLVLWYISLHNTLPTSPEVLRPAATKVDISLSDCYKECQKRFKCRRITYLRRALFCRIYDARQVASSNPFGYQASPGLVQKDVDEIPQHDTTRHCTNNTCNITECPEAPSYQDMTIKGNMRNINAKIAYYCDNFFTVEFSTCIENGVWSVINPTCVTYSYEYAGRNTPGSTENPLFVLHDSYLDVCLKRCNETSGCVGVNFMTEDKTCISTHRSKTSWAFLEHSNYYYKIQYPMTLFRKDGLPYNFTFTEGTKFCESLGTRIASKSDLNLANQLGFSMCACGWVDIGVSMIVLQTDCWSFGVGVTQCWSQENFDVFCKNSNFVNVLV